MKISNEEKMLDAVADYLREHGWNVVVIGGTQVQQPLGSYSANYEFVVRFTGGKREAKAKVKPKPKRRKHGK